MGERHWLHLLNDGKNEMGPGRPVGFTFTKPWRKSRQCRQRGSGGSMESAQIEFKSFSANDSFTVTEVYRACDRGEGHG